MMHMRNWIIGLGAVACAGTAMAQPVALDAYDRGWYSQGGFHDPSNNNYFTGDTTGNADDFGELRSFFVFDLTALASRTLVGARLELSGTFWFTDQGFETFRLTSVGFAREPLVDGTGGVAAFNALGTGEVYGEVTRTGFLSGPLVVNLNQAFLDSVPYGGWLVLGGRLTTLTSRGAMFGSSSDGESSGSAMPRLILDDGLPEVPLPGAAGLGFVGLCFVAAQRRRRA
jgi:hypothetical protein